jgi:hypothetical protein
VKKTVIYWMSSAACALLSALSATTDASVLSTFQSWNPYVQVAYTPSWIHAGGTSSRQILPAGNLEDQFVFSSHTQTSDINFGGGFDFPVSFKRGWLNNFDFDFDYYSMKTFSVNGMDSQWQSPTVLWKYDLSNAVKLSAVLLDANVELYQYKAVQCFAGLGVDYSWIKTSDFKQVAQSPATPSTLAVAGSNYNQWLYHLNLGLHANLSRHFRANLLDAYYPYIPVKTGQATLSNTQLAPLTYHLSMNQLSLSLDYLF